jgi:Glyoxalase-like domain
VMVEGLRVANVTFACRHHHATATFWAGDRLHASRRQSELVRLRNGCEPSGPDLLFLPVADPGAPSRRVHVDFAAADADGAVTRLRELGGREVERHSGHGVS